MFKPSILVLASLLIASPAFADDGAVFGNATCGPVVSCSAYSGLDGGSQSLMNLVSMAEACVNNSFGFGSQDGHFEASMGLNYNRCLYPKPVPKAKQGFTMSPTCCLVEVGNDNCRLVCKLVGAK